MKVENITLGADPELFLERDGKIVSAEGTIGGTKNHPLPILRKGFAIQEDNVMVEFNIPPCTTSVEFSDSIGEVLDYLEAKYAMDNATLKIIPSATLESKYLQTKQAKKFGCEPDLNFYLKDTNPSPSPKTNLRVCGGHIHIGYDNPDFAISEKIVAAMDAVLGLESVILDDDLDRRKLYGKAGSFRAKEFGVEYRSLSNFWIKNDTLRIWAFNATLKAISLVNSGEIDNIIETYSKEIEYCINSNNKEIAKKLIKKLNYNKITTV